MNSQRGIAAGLRNGTSYSYECSNFSTEDAGEPVDFGVENGLTLSRATSTLERHTGAFSALGIAVKTSTLGVGLEVATPLSQHSNLSVTENYFIFQHGFGVDGIAYNAELNLKSTLLKVDIFRSHGGLHVSPGLLYFNNHMSSIAGVQGGAWFELGNHAFMSSVNHPVFGEMAVTYSRQLAPALTFGFGNIIPRSGSHFSVPFDVGVAYTGAAQLKLKFTGMACTDATDCFDMATDPDTQAALKQEQNDLNSTLQKLRLFPIISVGFAYRF